MSDEFARWVGLFCEQSPVSPPVASLALLRAIEVLVEIWVGVDVVAGGSPRAEHWADAFSALLRVELLRRLEEHPASLSPLPDALAALEAHPGDAAVSATERVRAAAELLRRLGAVTRDRRTEQRLHKEVRDLRSDPIAGVARAHLSMTAPGVVQGLDALSGAEGLSVYWPTAARKLAWTTLAPRIGFASNFLAMVVARVLSVDAARRLRSEVARGVLSEEASPASAASPGAPHAGVGLLLAHGASVAPGGALRLEFERAGAPSESVDVDFSLLRPRLDALAAVWSLPRLDLLVCVSGTQRCRVREPLAPWLEVVDVSDTGAQWIVSVLKRLDCAGLVEPPVWQSL